MCGRGNPSIQECLRLLVHVKVKASKQLFHLYAYQCIARLLNKMVARNPLRACKGRTCHIPIIYRTRSVLKKRKEDVELVER